MRPPLRKAIDMFNRQITVGVAKTPRPSKNAVDNAEPNPYLDPETIKDLVLDGAKLAGALYAGAKILNTVCEIATIAAKAKF